MNVSTDAVEAQSATTSRGQQIVDFVAAAPGRSYPENVKDAARQAFTDYIAVTVGSIDDGAPAAAAKAVRDWCAPGSATVFTKFRTAPALAALVNGTATHSQDYDDTHPLGAGHPSGPLWSTAFALGEHLGRSEEEVFGAFITGYEVMAKLGGGGPTGIGRAMQRNGFHPTSVVGRAGAACTAAVLYRLTPDQIASALGVAATTAGGLIGSFGSHSKPFHAGKAAMDGILAAQLAEGGFKAATNLFELEGGLLSAIVQDGTGIVPPLDDFGSNWEILGNGFKLFASCRATHASTETAMKLRDRIAGRPIARIHVKTHGHALVTAGKTRFDRGLDCKFSIAFCVAMALSGYKLLPADFEDHILEDQQIRALLKVIEIEPVVGQPPCEAHVEITMQDGEVLRATTEIIRGHPDNPLTWDDLKEKFMSLLEAPMGRDKAEELLATARSIDSPGAIAKVQALTAPEAGI